MKAFVLIIGFGLVMLHAAAAQEAQITKLEVATVKAVQKSGFLDISLDGKVSNSGTTVKSMIALAYNMGKAQIVGGPAWAETEFWAIQAKAQGITDVRQPNAVVLAVQGLLEDRFQLKVHRESRESSLYLLKVTKNKPKMKPYDEPATSSVTVPRAGSIRQTANEMIATGEPMSSFAKFLSLFAGRPVVDQTGLAGKYDFTLHWLSPPPIGGLQAPVDDKSRAGLFKAVQDIGLTLEASNASLDVLVIDSISRPSEN